MTYYDILLFYTRDCDCDGWPDYTTRRAGLSGTAYDGGGETIALLFDTH